MENNTAINPTNTTNNVTDQPKPQPTIADLQAQLDALKAEMADTLAAQKADAEKALAELKLEQAAKVSGRTKPDISSGAQDIQIEKAITAVGGLAKWGLLTPVQKAEAIGLQGSTGVTDKEIRQFFGKSSDAKAASQLMASSPARYRRLKTEAKLRGIL